MLKVMCNGMSIGRQAPYKRAYFECWDYWLATHAEGLGVSFVCVLWSSLSSKL